MLLFMSIQFAYPQQKALYEVIANADELRELLRKEKAEKKHYQNNYRVDIANGGAYIYMRCRHCKSRMSFKWCEEEELYRLNTFNNIHNHKYEFDRQQVYMDWIEKLPLNMQLATAKDIAVKNFHVSASKFYHTYQRIRRTAATFNQLIAILQRNDYQISMDPYPIKDGQLPKVLVAVSSQMKVNMKLYGQAICYDLTYNVISQISEQGRQYAVGIFTGVNCYNHIIPFGISIICQQTSSSFAMVFDTFININGEPKSFITDEQNAIASAINKLQNNGAFSGTHLLDAFHVIRNFAKMSNRKDLMAEVRDIIVEANHQNFEMRMNNLKNKLNKQHQLKAFQLFAKKTQMVCFSQLPHGSFVIFNCSTSINQKMNDMLKARVRKRKPYTQTLKTIAQYCELLIESSQKSVNLYDFRIEEVFNDYDLQVCRYLLAQRPMKELINQYVASFRLKQPFIKGDQYNFKQNSENHQSLYGKQMICTCGYHQKTGIPCKHMILICRQKKRSYIQFTHPRWKFDQNRNVLKIEKYKSKRKE